MTDTGHFTQIVWKSTEQLGCGLAITTDNRVYGVCNYFPQGNVINQGYFEENVQPLKQLASSLSLDKFLYFSIFTIILIKL